MLKKDGKEESEITEISIKQLLQDFFLGPVRTGQDAGLHKGRDTAGKEGEACAYIHIHTQKALNVKDRRTLESAAREDLFHHCSLHHQQIAKNR